MFSVANFSKAARISGVGLILDPFVVLGAIVMPLQGDNVSGVQLGEGDITVMCAWFKLLSKCSGGALLNRQFRGTVKTAEYAFKAIS